MLPARLLALNDGTADNLRTGLAAALRNRQLRRIVIVVIRRPDNAAARLIFNAALELKAVIAQVLPANL